MRCKVRKAGRRRSRRATPSPFPASVYDKGPAGTHSSSGGPGFRFIARCLRFVCPRRQPPESPSGQQLCISQAQSGHVGLERDDRCVSRVLATRAPRPTSRLIWRSQPISRHTCASGARMFPHVRLLSTQGRGREKKPVIDRPKLYNDLVRPGGERKKNTQ